MSFNTQEAKEAVLTLRDRLKHGQNMTKILESQLETAQQNISLLQGQVRLANETILNLKKYFQETENTVNELLTPTTNQQSSRVFQYNETNSSKKDESSERKHPPLSSHSSRKSSRSPITPEPLEPKGTEDKRDHHNKSPYAQQLRQVLDALQDEEPKKAMYRQLHERECEETHQQQSHSRPSSASSNKPYHSENETGYHHRRTEEDYEKPKQHRSNGYASHDHQENSPKPSLFYRGGGGQTEMGHRHPHHPHQHIHQSYSSNHCMGPCCQSEPSPSKNNNNSYKMAENNHHYVDEKSHYVEKSPAGSGGARYIAMHSPDEMSSKHHPDTSRHHNGGQHYVSYAYRMQVGPTESPTHKAIHEMAQPMSPTGRRKRAYVPLLPNEEPPHLKYTKVKRIDGSKLTAQKVLQDFTKRRFISYDPKYDLDLLIVPPPILASDFVKGSHQVTVVKDGDAKVPTLSPPPQTPNGDFLNEKQQQRKQRSAMYGGESLSPRSIEDEDVFMDLKISDDGDANNNNNCDLHDDNNNRSSGNSSWSKKTNYYTPKGVSVLPSIKEEARSKLEDQINKLRNGQESGMSSPYRRQQHSPFNDSNNNNDSVNTASPIAHVNRHRTKQYCT